MSSSLASTLPLPEPPPHFRWIAWQGLALLVPATWDLGKHQGDHLHGSIRLDGDGGVRMQLRWMPARMMPDPLRAAEQLAAAPRDLPRSTPISVYPLDLPTPAAPATASAAVSRVIEGVTREIIIAVVAESLKRAFVMRLPLHADWPDHETVRMIVKNLRLYSSDSPWPWAFFDLHCTSPAGFMLKEASLSVGVCHLRFAHKRRHLGLRRFSAANAAMGLLEPDDAAVERWFRAIYARDFHDMDYHVERLPNRATRSERDDDTHRWLLTPRHRRRVALELGWILPQHRYPPRAIVIGWNRALNKIACFEFDEPVERDPSQWPVGLREWVDSWHTETFSPDPLVHSSRPTEPESRTRSLQALVSPAPSVTVTRRPTGQITLEVQVTRPPSLRWLRRLAGMSAGPVSQQRRIELDLLGTVIWDRIAAQPAPVADLIEHIRDPFRITPHEAERAVTEFVRALGQRNLVILQAEPRDPHDPNEPAEDS